MFKWFRCGDQDGSNAHIWLQPLENLHLHNQETWNLETWFLTRGLERLFKWWFQVDLWHFIEKVNFIFLWILCSYGKNSENCIYRELLKIWQKYFIKQKKTKKKMEMYQCKGYWNTFDLRFKVLWIWIFKQLLIRNSWANYIHISHFATWGTIV